LQVENAGSVAANRIAGKIDIVVASGISIDFFYDGTTSRWSRKGTDTQYLKEQTLVVTAGSAAWDMALGTNALVNLTVATTALANSTNQILGQSGIIRFLVDATGGRLLTFGTSYKIVTDAFWSGANYETEYFYKVVAASGANSIELRAKTRPFVLYPSAATTSGTSVDFTNIPLWAKKITIFLNGVQYGTSASYALVQIGNATVETTGYVSSSLNAGGSNTGQITTGFAVFQGAGTFNLFGKMVLSIFSGNIWIADHSINTNTSPNFLIGNGIKTTASVVNILRLTSQTPNTFNAGSATILVEG
jgi:hypothetical protein